MSRTSFLVIALATSLFLAACGGSSNTSSSASPMGNSVPMILTIGDTPPSGVIILFSQLSLTSAALQPGNVSLLASGTTSIPINVSDLQTDVAFLSTASVPMGSYNELDLTFAANPQITIFNGSGSTVGSGADTCANDTVCILTATNPSPTTLKLMGTPFPVNLSATSSPVVLQLDIHLNAIIQSDLTVNLNATNGVSVDRVADVQAMPLGHLTGAVQSVGANQFTLATGDGDKDDTRTFTINVNSSTTYSDFPSGTNCTTQAFSCVASGQIVKVLVSLQPGGGLLADSVTFEELVTQVVAEGTIVALSKDTSGNTVMDLVLEKGPPPPLTATALLFGHRVAVTISPTATFAIDNGNFTIPSGLAFTGPSSLVVGQEVQVVANGSISTTAAAADDKDGPFGPANLSFTTSSVKLETSQITGQITTINTTALSFVIDEKFQNFRLPPSPTAAGAPPTPAPVLVAVDTTAQTAFDTASGFGALTSGDIVSVDGWLFATPTGATAMTIAADKVHVRDSDPDL